MSDLIEIRSVVLEVKGRTLCVQIMQRKERLVIRLLRYTRKANVQFRYT